MGKIRIWITPPTSPKWWLCAGFGIGMGAVLFHGGYVAPGPVPFVLFLALTAGFYYAGVQDALSRLDGPDDDGDDGDDTPEDPDPDGPGGRQLTQDLPADPAKARVLVRK